MAAYLLYDGDCGFCTAAARFIERHVPTPARVQAWQDTDLGALGLTAQQCRQAVRWVELETSGGRTSAAGAAAIAALLVSSSRWRWAGRVLGRRPVLAVAEPGYRWVARHRHRLPGGSRPAGATVACGVAAKPAGDRPPRGPSRDHSP